MLRRTRLLRYLYRVTALPLLLSGVMVGAGTPGVQSENGRPRSTDRQAPARSASSTARQQDQQETTARPRRSRPRQSANRGQTRIRRPTQPGTTATGNRRPSSPRQRQPGVQTRRPRQRPSPSSRTSANRRRRTRPVPTRRPKPYSGIQLRALAADITALNGQLADLNRRTTRRFDRLASLEKLPPGQRYRFAEDQRSALQLAQQIDEHPENSAPLITLAHLQIRNRKQAEAEATLLKALALEPLNQELTFDLGELYLSMGKSGQAWDAFQEIIYQKPEQAQARLAQGRVLEHEGDYEGAMDIYTQVEADFGPSAEVNFHQARNLSAQGDHGAAVAQAREGLVRNPDSAPLAYVRGRAYAALGMLDRAKTDLYAALALNPDLLEVYETLGAIFMETGNYPAAEAAYLKVLRARPGDEEASFALGHAYLMDLKFQQAAEEWDRLAYLHGDNGKVNHWRSQAYYLHSLELNRQGQFQSALNARRNALALAGGHSTGWVVPALIGAGAAARAHGDYPRSIDYYDQALEMDPFSADGYIGLSRTYTAMQDSSRARESLLQALALDPDHPGAWAAQERFTRP